MSPIKRFFQKITNREQDFQERLFILLTSVAELAVFFAFLGDLVTGENIIETLVLGIVCVAGPAIVLLSIRMNKVKIGSVLIAFAIVFIVLPVVFFFGGGLEGGAILWFAFSYLYVGLILTGAVRTVMLILISALAVAEYFVAYFYPDLIAPHSRSMWFIDSAISVLLVGFMIYIMVLFQNKLFQNENEQAREQAKKIEELNESQNRFFSSMSHEIRTPINTIIGLNEMTLRENVSPEINENAANIQAASKMLLNIINDILDMSKFESGQMQLTKTPYHTGDMLSDIVGMLWLKAKEKNLAFHISVAPDLPEELIGDEVRIKQVLVNVLNNAIKYTSEGSVTLSIQCTRTGNSGVNVIYSVSDTGMGIKKENIPYLFTAFKRVDEEKNRYIEGTGLGLSIVKQFVDLMGGKITVNSVYTKGSTFMIEIPQQIGSDTNIGVLDMEKRHDLNRSVNYHQSFEAPGARVLAVDDTAANLLVVTKLLRDTKIQLDTAESGRKALEMTLETRFDVILMDHMMPEMDGIECMHKIREQVGGLSKEARIIALTANTGGESAALYAREGFDGYLVKPISGESLEDEMRRQLPRDLIRLTSSNEELLEESLSWNSTLTKKAQVAITTESVADLPKALTDRYRIGVLPHMVVTEDGVFRDGVEIEQQGLLAYMLKNANEIHTLAPDVNAHEAFFAEQMTRANNIVHISISSHMTHSGCPTAIEASQAFDNVSVVDSLHLSSGQGLMALEAARMAEEGKSAEEIVQAMEELKSRIRTSFVVDNLDFLARARQINQKIADITKALMIRPVLAMKNGKLGVGRIYLGSRQQAWKRYIRAALRNPSAIDHRTLFVTYVGLTQEDLAWIREQIESKETFGQIIFQKASAAIGVNCGAGTFGLLYIMKE